MVEAIAGPGSEIFDCKTCQRRVDAAGQELPANQREHFGVGFTVEHDVQLYFRRAKALQLNWWDERACERRSAHTVLD